MANISVIGAGAWGTALACISRRAGNNVALWALESEVVDAVNAERRNPIYLPDITLDEGIMATGNHAKAVNNSDLILSVVPSQFFRNVAQEIAQHIPASTPIVLCS